MVVTMKVQDLMEDALERIQRLQTAEGLFPCHQKINTGQSTDRWQESIPIPFITASVLCSLKEIRSEKTEEIFSRGYRYLTGLQEYGGLWRYWQHHAAADRVPPDADDTCLCSFFIKTYKKNVLENVNWITENCNSEGMLLTWFVPRAQFEKYPALHSALLEDADYYQDTVRKGYLHPDDWEIAVMANILLYLGENAATARAVQFIADSLINDRPFEKQFYKEDAVIWYHVARAYHNGIRSFAVLRETALRKWHPLMQQIPEQPETHCALLAAITLSYFNLPVTGTPFYDWILSAPPAALEDIFPYYHSKDSLFTAGAPALNWAWYAELLHQLSR